MLCRQIQDEEYLKTKCETECSLQSADVALRGIIGRAPHAMRLAFEDDGNYDEFDCSYWFMKPECDYLMWDLDKIVIVKDVLDNSQGACIYAKMQRLDGYWMCADNSGNFGFTTINPAKSGYCTEETVKCPPTTKFIPEWGFNFN